MGADDDVSPQNLLEDEKLASNEVPSASYDGQRDSKGSRSTLNKSEKPGLFTSVSRMLLSSKSTLRSRGPSRISISAFAAEEVSQIIASSAIQKMRDGRPVALTIPDVTDWFGTISIKDEARVIGKAKGNVVVACLKELFSASGQEIAKLESLIQPATDDEDRITAEDFVGLVTDGPGLELLQHLAQTSCGKSKLDDRASLPSNVDRSELHQHLQSTVDEDDFLATLPFSIVYLLIFLALVITHLRIKERYQVERGLETWLGGYGSDYQGPFLVENVQDVGTFGVWLSTSGLGAFLGDVQNATGRLLPRLATTNVLLGDLKLVQTLRDGSEESVWLLHTEAARAVLDRGPPGAARLQEAGTEACTWLQRHWFRPDSELKDLHLDFAAYSDQARLFSLTRIHVPMFRDGHVDTRLMVGSARILSYPEAWVIGLDVVYLALIAYTTYHESKDLLLAWRLGEVKDYFTVWNIIDWTNIVFCGAISLIWLMCCLAMSADSLWSLVTDGGDLASNVVDLSTRQLDAIHESLSGIRSFFMVFHVALALNTGTFIMRFFKGFMPNEYMSMVLNTFVDTWQDIAHFVLVFFTFFFSFAMSGHVLFGDDVDEFSTIWRSIDTCARVLFGDFGWYEHHFVTEYSNLPSGMPKILMTFWFVAFILIVVLVAVNILVAIILNGYSARLGNTGEDTLAIWSQSAQFLRRKELARKHIPLEKILVQLDNDESPAHPQPNVTVESLQKAFSEMSEQQAQTLVNTVALKANTDFVAERAVKQKADLDSRALRIMRFACKDLEDAQRQLGVLLDIMGKLRNTTAEFTRMLPEPLLLRYT